MNIRSIILPTLLTLACVSIETSTFAADALDAPAPATPVVLSHLQIMESLRGTSEFLHSTTPTTAPFTADDVIAHAGTYPENYKMAYLESSEGKAKIEATLKIIRTTGFPPNDANSANDRWNRGTPNANYNKSVIADYVSVKFGK